MKELYEKGLSHKSFIFNLDKEERKKFIKNQISIAIDAEYRQQVSQIKIPIKILGIVDIGNTNSYYNLPLVEKLVCTNSNIELKIIISEHCNHSINIYGIRDVVQMPAFIFMDGDYNLLGVFHGENFITIKILEGIYETTKIILDSNEQDCIDRVIGGVISIIKQVC